MTHTQFIVFIDEYRVTKNEPIIVRINAVGRKIVALDFFCGWCAKATAICLSYRENGINHYYFY